MSSSREMLGSRLGFVLLSVGCAVGLGNVWRFPFIVGQNGGGCFLIVFLLFQLAITPVLITEFAIGRASRTSLGLSMLRLEPKGTAWHRLGWISYAGSYLLLMFYTCVCGWLLLYAWHMLAGHFQGLDTNGVKALFGGMLASPSTQILATTLSVAIGAGVCSMGLQGGVEKVSKFLMSGLFLLLLLLVGYSLSLNGAADGMRFYLLPDADRFADHGLASICSAALCQAFFTLSIGIGSMSIFGSYMDKKRSLAGEALIVTGLDFLVALLAGCIIFPACFTFGIEPGAGPTLIFITLPNIFASLLGGRFWGSLFFLFMSFAAVTTVIAVFENIVAYSMDCWGWSRRKSTIVNFLALWLLSLPCGLGFNILSGFQPFGPNSGILDLEDFIVSDNLLPLGGLMMVLFCTLRRGWGWEGFIEEVNTGDGLHLPGWFRPYMSYVLPVLIFVLFCLGYINRFGG